MAIDILKNYVPGIRENGISTDSTVVLSGTNTLSGTTTISGATTLSGTTTTISGALAATSTVALGVTNYANQVTNTGGAYATPIVLTTAQSGRVVLVNDAAGLDFTLPAIATADVGTRFSFVVTTTVTSNNFRVTAAAGDLLNGAVWLADFDTANTGTYFAANGSSNLVVTCNGTTTGGKKGTWLDFIAISATGWWVQGNMFGDGTLATPFSG